MDTSWGYELMIEKNDLGKKELQMEYKLQGKDVYPVKHVQKNNPLTLAMCHNLKIVQENVPFSKFDSDIYTLERI